MADYELLARRAREAARFSYSPYSGYRVGAALLCADGEIFTGCNVENAAYGPTNCAERTAVFKAVSEGKRRFSAIAVWGGRDDGSGGYAVPCGVCLQVLLEFCDPVEFVVLAMNPAGEKREYRLAELIPHGFRLGEDEREPG